MVFPGTVTDRGYEPVPEAAVKQPEMGLCKRSVFRISSVLELVAWFGFIDEKLGLEFTLAALGSEMESRPWLVLVL